MIFGALEATSGLCLAVRRDMAYALADETLPPFGGRVASYVVKLEVVEVAFQDEFLGVFLTVDEHLYVRGFRSVRTSF